MAEPLAEVKPEVPSEEAGQAAPRGGFGRGRGRGRGPRGKRGARGGRTPESELKDWKPVTKLGRLVKSGKITSLEEIYQFSIPIKECQIVDKLCPELKDEVMSVVSVQKQTAAGQRTRFKAFVAVGDKKGHLGLGIKCSKEVASSINVAIKLAKISVIPIRMGYWGNKVGMPHTVVAKVTGKCGSIRVRLVPAPRGTGIVASIVPKRLLALAGLEDVYTTSTGHTRTLGNYVQAVYHALASTYAFMTPDLWKIKGYAPTPYQKFTDDLLKDDEDVSAVH